MRWPLPVARFCDQAGRPLLMRGIGGQRLVAPLIPPIVACFLCSSVCGPKICLLLQARSLHLRTLAAGVRCALCCYQLNSGGDTGTCCRCIAAMIADQLCCVAGPVRCISRIIAAACVVSHKHALVDQLYVLLSSILMDVHEPVCIPFLPQHV